MHANAKGPHPRRNPNRLRPLALVLVLSLALPASALAASFRITPHMESHIPTINRRWLVRLTVTMGRTKLSGRVNYEFLFDGSVVGTRPGRRFSDGVYTDSMIFPERSLAEPLTLRILVTVPRYGTEHVDWKISTRKGARPAAAGVLERRRVSRVAGKASQQPGTDA